MSNLVKRGILDHTVRNYGVKWVYRLEKMVKILDRMPLRPGLRLTFWQSDGIISYVWLCLRGVCDVLEKLKSSDKVVGTRRLIKAIQAGEIAEAYVAQDADLYIVRQVREACNQAGVRIVEAESMKALGEACGVEVKTASAGIRRA